ncbi:penicillin-binding protein 1A [Alcanivorax borkumensis]|uniref:Penicillin-binding protein 1A n=1 Tax=Alcanivorax borkumensis (strain ATCC 700651 / DSM 11573 / NCIMB 13689 / SK2) TaxID=393595 RepID=Q0VMS2_ALCBS|nr:penicillin-binding protein 1A [Alcanivorax borkumensis]CAL17526.1 penicillin-binding protein, putative [Alcanivorax borkumensis SK2]
MRFPPWIRYLLLLLIAGTGGGLSILAASYLYLAPQLPPASQIREVEYQIPLRIYSSDMKLIAEYGEKRRQPVSYEELPEGLIQAVLAAEDERFFSHNGVDLKGLLRAAVELARYREIRSGGSTITMQVARNFFLNRDQRFLRKFNEIVLAIQIERVLEKEEILELYLNKIYLGHRAYGAEAAAQVYYGKSVGELDIAQQAMIAGLPKAPSAYNPITNPERARVRRNWILFRMEETGALTQEERMAAQAEPVSARFHAAQPEVEAAYLGEMVRLQAAKLVDDDIFTDGIRIITTVDSQRQKAAVHALRNGLHSYDERHGYRGPIAQRDLSDAPALPALSSADNEQPDADDGELPKQEDKAEIEKTITGLDPSVASWAKLIRDQRRIGPLQPVIVTRVGDQDADILFRDGKRASLAWDDIRWARPQLNNKYVGDKPQKAGDVLTRGDVVRVRPVGSEDSRRWRLAQLPKAQSALVSLDPANGAIVAMQGGYSFSASNFNRAVQSERQAGSVFKPFIYTSAMENGFTPASIINDAPVVFDDDKLETAWRPTGASGKFYGPTRMREALYRSLNLVSIRILRQIGISQAMGTLKRFGLPADTFQRDLSLALGSASVTPLDIANAYSVFANGGYRVTPWAIERIENANGDVLWKAPEVILCEPPCLPPVELREETQNDKPTLTEMRDRQESDAPDAPLKTIQPAPIMAPRVLDPRVAWLMNSMLQDVIRMGTGSKARALGRDDLAGKTGTTNDQVDAWFSGYSPDLVATVWVGFDNPANLGWGEYGGKAALPIWIDYMGPALQGVEERQLEQPSGIATVRIDPDSGLLARPDNPNAIREYFIEDQVPELEPQRGPGGSNSAPEQIF